MSDYRMIRPDIIESIQLYVKVGCPPGGFLEAALSNDLKGACARADEDNKHALWNIVAYLYSEVPSNCWGTPEKVTRWLSKDWTTARQAMRTES